MFPGANWGASCGVLVKILNPQRISFESFESSSDASVRGFFGNSQAVVIVVFEEMRGPLNFGGGGGAFLAHAAANREKVTTAASLPNRVISQFPLSTAARSRVRARPAPLRQSVRKSHHYEIRPS